MHRLIVGKTGSGKSTLAKIMAYQHWRAGERVFVLDAQGDTWHCHAQFGRGHFDRFVHFLLDGEGVGGGAVFLDETGLDERSYRDIANNRLIIDSRHRGLALYFIAHRILTLPPIIRENCTTVYAFQQSPEDAALGARIWYEPGHPMLLTPHLRRWQFGKIVNFRGATWHEIRARRKSEGAPPRVDQSTL